jgi:hypothetical protein
MDRTEVSHGETPTAIKPGSDSLFAINGLLMDIYSLNPDPHLRNAIHAAWLRREGRINIRVLFRPPPRERVQCQGTLNPLMR